MSAAARKLPEPPPRTSVHKTLPDAMAAAKRSPAREALAKAITARDQAKLRVDEAGGAVERVSALVVAAEARLTAANNAARAARDRHAERIAAAAAANSAMPALGETRAAITEELEAKDALDAAQKAIRISRTALSAVSESWASAQKRVAAAADAVIKAEIEPIVSRAAALANELIVIRVGLRWLSSNNLLDLRPNVSLMVRVYPEMPNVPGGVESGRDWLREPEGLKWGAMRAALLNDADTELPISG